MSQRGNHPNQSVSQYEAARLAVMQLRVTASSPQSVFQSICRITAEALNIERVSIWFFSPSREILQCRCLFERSQNRFSDGQTLRIADFPNYFSVIGLRRTLPSEWVEHDPAMVELRERYLIPNGITSLLDTGIFSAGEMVGIICHEHVGPPRSFRIEDMDFVTSVADIISMKCRLAPSSGVETRSQDTLESTIDDTGLSVVRPADPDLPSYGHDLKNLLTVILGNIQLIEKKVHIPKPYQSLLTQVVNAAESAARLAQEMMSHQREHEQPLPYLELVGSLEDLVTLFEYQLPDTITFIREIDIASPVWVKMNRNQLERILNNLVCNARDAMTNGGRLSVRLFSDQPRAISATPVRVVLEISDQGTGIPTELLKKIFEPYFTTKPDGQGTGLGLPIVKQIVENCSGEIQVESQLGIGTTFRLLLPIAQDESIEFRKPAL